MGLDGPKSGKRFCEPSGRLRCQVSVGRRNPFLQYRRYPLFDVVRSRIPADSLNSR
jgi:hypothetical protein